MHASRPSCLTLSDDCPALQLVNAEVVVTGSDPHTWEPNVEEIEQVLQTRPVRAVVLTNPGNPSGAVLGVPAIQVKLVRVHPFA